MDRRQPVVTKIIGGPHDGETLEATISIAMVPMSHVVDDQLLGVAWYAYDRDADVLRFHRYEDYTWLGAS